GGDTPATPEVLDAPSGSSVQRPRGRRLLMSTRESLKELHENKKGAVMLTGLCMSCFLIGSLWFVIGIGDAIVFRDTMQEVADHSAFTSAVVHARGMNFISACNLILLAMITIHIILGLIHDILLAFCILFAIPTLGAS